MKMAQCNERSVLVALTCGVLQERAMSVSQDYHARPRRPGINFNDLDVRTNPLARQTLPRTVDPALLE